MSDPDDLRQDARDEARYAHLEWLKDLEELNKEEEPEDTEDEDPFQSSDPETQYPHFGPDE